MPYYPYGYRRRGWPRWSELSHPKRMLVLGLLAFFLALFAWLGWGFFGIEHQTGKIVLCRWEWHIDVEKWEKVHYNDTTWSHPANCRDRNFCGGTYNRTEWEESYPVTQVMPDGRGGTTTTTRIEYEDHYRYDHDEWVYHRTFSRAGTDKEPRPPEDFHLENFKTNARTHHGCRVGGVRRPYFVIVECEDGQTRTWETTDFDAWRVWSNGDLVDVSLTGFGEVRGLAQLMVEAE